jgi:hypothetical protein
MRNMGDQKAQRNGKVQQRLMREISQPEMADHRIP